MKDPDNIQSGFDGALHAGKNLALLIIDFQRGFTEPGLSPLASDCDSAVQATARFIKTFRGHGPIIFTINGYAPNLSDMGRWGGNAARLRHWCGARQHVNLIPALVILRKTT